MTKVESDSPDSITQPLPYLVEDGTGTTVVSFNKDFSPVARDIILGIIKGQKNKDIAEEAGIGPHRFSSTMESIKKGIVKRGLVWPPDKHALIYALQELGDISVKKIAK